MGSISDTADVTVTAGSATGIKVTPATASVQVKGSTTFTAEGTDACGNTATISPAPTWTVSSTTIGSISAAGVFTAGCTAGTHTGAVTAQSGTLTGKADVTITKGALDKLTISPQNVTIPAGGTQTFTAQGADSCGNALAASASWSVVAGGGTITSAGVFTAGSQAGTFVDTVQAASGGVSAKTSVTVTAGNVAKIVVTPNPGKVGVGQTISFSAQAYDTGNNPVAASFTWSAATGGTIDSAGKFTAGTTSGTFTDAVVATAGGVSGKATVEIAPGPAATVTVAPSTITIAPGGSSSFTASVKDGWGNILTGPVTWAVSPAAAGTIDGSGKFTAGTALGTYLDAVTATSGSATGKASVVIKSGALHHLVITPTSAKLKPSATVAFSVEGRDDKNNSVSVTPTWKVVAGGGTMNNQGIFAAGTKAGTFTDTVQALASGLSVTASVVVEPGPLNSISITPTHATLKPGEARQFVASGTDSWGNSVALSSLVWSAESDAGVIDQKGLFTAGATKGDWPSAVKAKMGSISASAGVRISDGTTDMDPIDLDEGCSCSLGAGHERSAGTLLPLLLALGLMLRRRRR